MLLLIDGLPGSGKSTVAKELGGLIPGSRVHMEMDPDNPLHPIHPGDEVADFREVETMTPEALAGAALARYREFAAAAGSEVHIAESHPFQSSVRLLLQIDAPEDIIADFARKSKAALAPADPHLVHLAHPNADWLDRVIEIRGPEWTAQVVDFVSACRWSRNRSLSGMPALRAVMQEYARMLEELVDAWSLPRLELAGGKELEADAAERVTRWISKRRQ